MSKVVTKAENLADAIVESEEYQAMVEAEEKMDADEKASNLVKEVEFLQKKIDQNKDSEELKKEMAALQKDVWENNKVKSFMQKQQEFSKLMSNINEKLNNLISSKN